MAGSSVAGTEPNQPMGSHERTEANATENQAASAPVHEFFKHFYTLQRFKYRRVASGFNTLLLDQGCRESIYAERKHPCRPMTPYWGDIDDFPCIMQSFKWKSKLDRPVLELIKLHDHTSNVILSEFVADFNEFLDVERNLNVLHLLGCGPELEQKSG